MTNEDDLIRDFFFEPSGIVTVAPEDMPMADVPDDITPEDFFFSEAEVESLKQEKPISEYRRGELGNELLETGKKVLETGATGAINALESFVEIPATIATALGTSIVQGYEGIMSLMTGKDLNVAVDRMTSHEKYPENVKNFVRSQFTKYTPEFSEKPYVLSDEVYKGIGWIAEPHEKAVNYAGESAFEYAGAIGVSPEIQAIYATANKMTAESLLGGVEALVGKEAIRGSKLALKTGKTVLDISTGKVSIDKIRKQAIDNAVKTAEENWIKQISDNQQIMESLRDSIELENSIPGFKLDLSEATGAETLMMEKKALLRSEEGAKAAAQIRQDNKNILAKESNRLFGENADDSFKELVTKSSGTYKSIIENIDNELLNSRKKLGRYQINYERQGVLNYENGKAMQRELYKMYRLNKAKGDILWKGIEDVPIDVAPAVAHARQILQTKNLWNENEFPLTVRNLSGVGSDESASVANRLKQIESQIQQESTMTAKTIDPQGSAKRVQALQLEAQQLRSRPPVSNMSLRDIKDLYSDINSTYIAEKHRLKSDIDPTVHRQRMRHLSSLKETMENVLDAAEQNPQLASKVGQYRTAKEFWKKEVAQPFQTGIAGDILIPGAKKEFVMAGEDVVKNAFKTAKVDEFRDFVNVAKRSESLYTRLRDSIVNEYSNAVTKKVKLKDGNVIQMIDSDSHERFFLQNGPVLREVPEIRDQLKNIHKSADNIQQSMLSQLERKMRVQDSQLYKLIDGGDSNTFFTKIKKADGAKEILRAAKEIGVPMSSIERVAASLIYKNSLDMSDIGSHVISPSKLAKYIEQNDGLKLILPESRRKQMMTLAKAGEKINYKLNFDFKPESPTLWGRVEEITGRTGSQIVTNIRHMKQRIVSPTFVAQDLVMSTLATMNKSKINQILVDSMFKPDLADIMEKATKEQISRGKVSFDTGIKLYNKLYQMGTISSIMAVQNQPGVQIREDEARRNREQQLLMQKRMAGEKLKTLYKQ